MSSFLTWLENSALGIWMAESLWGYPLVLSSHAIGMAIVVGTVVMIDLRVLGYAPQVSIQSFKRLFAIAWFGVVLNVCSGLALFCADPMHFFYHPVFWIKLGLILLGAVSVYLLLRSTMGEGQPAISRQAKMVAGLSLIFWFSAIIAGRLIAYVEVSG